MTPQSLASMKAREHQGRKPVAEPKKKGFLQRAGDWLVGDADLTSPRDWVMGLADAANDNLIQPLYRTASGRNVRTAVSPSSTLNQRIQAVGEDALNVLSVIPLAGPAARTSVAAERAGARALATARANAVNKLTPSADLSTYLFHGGPTPDKLVGGVLDPDYVRGGEKFAELNPARAAREPSVLHGPNATQKRNIVEEFESAQNFLAGKGGRGSFNYPAEKPLGMSTRDYLSGRQRQVQKAQDYIEQHDEIVRRIRAGEEHQTGVHRSSPDMAYSQMGGTYVLDVPSNMQTIPPLTPAGEVTFWGKQKPVGFVPSSKDPRNIEVSRVVQTMLDDADKKSTQSQRLANMLFRARGGDVTPAYKKYVEEVLNKELGGTFRGFVKNPDYQKTPRDILEYFTDWQAPEIPKVQNMNEVISAVGKAKTKDEVMSILETMVPAEQLDILLQSGLNRKGTFPEVLQRIKGQLELLNPSYARLKK